MLNFFSFQMILKLEEITKEREVYMERLWSEFQAILNEYLRSTEDYRNEYMELRQRDSTDTKYIQNHYLEVARATEIIGDLKQRYTMIKDEHEFNIQQLEKYRNELHTRSENLKQELNIGLNTDKTKLKQLVLYSSRVLKKLEALDKRGKHIMQIANFCAKYESDRDDNRMRPRKAFLELTDGDEISEELKALLDKPDTLQNQLDYFWRRYNKTKIDCACMKEEKQALKTDNMRLKAVLKDYLVNINICTGTTIKSSRGETFIPRPHSMKVEKVMHIDLNKTSLGKGEMRARRRPVTCIEANMSVAVRSQKLLEMYDRPPEIYSLVPKA